MSLNAKPDRRGAGGDRRRSRVDRRQPPRPLKCTHCGVLLAFERRDSLVALYQSSSPPVSVKPAEAETAPKDVPRCVVCSTPLAVPIQDPSIDVM